MDERDNPGDGQPPHLAQLTGRSRRLATRLADVVGIAVDDARLPEILRIIAHDLVSWQPQGALIEALLSHLRDLVSAAGDRSRLPAQKPQPEVSLWLAGFHYKLDSHHVGRLRSLRAQALAVALAERSTIAGDLAHGIRQCMVSRNSQWLLTLGHPAAGQAAREAAESSKAQQAFVKQLIDLDRRVQAHNNNGWHALTNLVREPHATGSVDSSVAGSPALAPPRSTQEVARATPRRLVHEKLIQAERASRPERAGLASTYRVLSRQEVRRIVTLAHAQARRGEAERLNAVMIQLVLLSGCTQRTVRVISLDPSGAEIWLDIDAGSLCWDWSRVVGLAPERWHDSSQQSVSHWVCIPLPEDLASALEQLRRARPAARCVGDLFPADLVNNRSLNELLAQVLPGGAHRAKQWILARSYAAIVLSVVQDELLAAAIAIDFRSCPAANFHYAVVSGDTIWKHVQLVYEACGLRQPVSAVMGQQVGTPFLVDEMQLASQVRAGLDAACLSLWRLPRNCGVERLRTIHNALAQAVHEAVLLFSGHRYPLSAVMQAGDVCHESGTLVVSDKRQDGFHDRRVAVLPSRVRDWVRLYVAWAGLLGRRLKAASIGHPRRGAMLETAIHLGALGTPKACHGAATLTVLIQQDWSLTSCRAEGLRQLAGAGGVAPNFGRHLLDKLLRGQGVQTTALNAALGRGGVAQRLHAASSLGSIMQNLQVVRAALDAALERWQLPQPPSLSGRGEQPEVAMSPQSPRQAPTGRACPGGVQP